MYSSDDCDDLSGLFGTLSSGEFNPMAYVKPVVTEKGTAYGVFAADGTQLALFGSREAAYFAAKQHDLEPVLIH
jgi:hypothetical protein